jgi:hypothetical protein
MHQGIDETALESTSTKRLMRKFADDIKGDDPNDSVNIQCAYALLYWI